MPILMTRFRIRAGRVTPAADEQYMGWTNRATYLFSRYIYSRKVQEELFGLCRVIEWDHYDATGSIPDASRQSAVNKLAQSFKEMATRRVTEAREVMHDLHFSYITLRRLIDDVDYFQVAEHIALLRGWIEKTGGSYGHA